MQLSYFDFIKKSNITELNKIFIVTGNEHLQCYNVIQKVTTTFKRKSYEISEHQITEKNHNELYHEVDNLSLFSVNKLVKFNFEKPPLKNLQQALISNLLKPSSNVYLLVFNDVKKQTLTTKWFQDISQKAIHIKIYQPDINTAIKIINHEIEQFKIYLDEEAIQLLAQKTEGNLISARQILQLLSKQNKSNFDLENIKPFLHEHNSFDSFDLSDAILTQKKSKSISILNNILNKKDKSSLILWSLKKKLRTLSQLQSTKQINHQKIFNENNIWPSKQNLYLNLANKINKEIISNNLKRCLHIDLYLKGAKKGNVLLELNKVVLALLP